MSDPPVIDVESEILSEEAKKKKEDAIRDQNIAKEVMLKVGALVKASKGLPRCGDDYELCNSFATFNGFMKQQELRLQSLVARVMETAGCPVRAPKVGSPVEEYMKKIVDANDSLVERMGIVMDEMERAGRDEEVHVPKAVIGAESTKRMAARSFIPFSTLSTPIPHDLSARLRAAREKQQEFLKSNTTIEKPQKNFSDLIDTSRDPFLSKLRLKHHPRDETRKGITLIDHDSNDRSEWTGSDGDMGHPYRVELDHFQPPASQLNSTAPKKYGELESTPLKVVNTVETLKEIRDVLNSVKEFSVDLEHHDTRTFLGLTCLIQISTREQDFIIDPFPIWAEMHILNEPFTDPKILKVFHGADSDIQWLQRDFGIHVVNMFDTYHAMRRLEFPKFSLQFLVQTYCQVALNKQYQTSDWRIRPLSKEQMDYARCDTHYLLFCYDELREALLTKGNEMKNLLTAVYNDSVLVCGKVYEKPIFDPLGYEPLLSAKRTFNSRQVYAVRELWAWRDRVAREEDEGINYVLPSHMMLYIAESLPREVQGIIACCNPVPEMVRKHQLDIHKIVYAARDQPLVLGFVQKQTDGVERTLLMTMMDQQNRMTMQKSILRSSMDFSHTRFDEEIGTLNISKEEGVVTEAENSVVGTISSYVGNHSAVTVEQSAPNDNKKRDKIIADLSNWATPFECYVIGVKKAAEREEKRRAEEERRKRENGEGEKKTFSHHDPCAKRSDVPIGQVNVDNIALSSAPKGRFTDDQVLTKKALAKKRKHTRKAADIRFGEKPQAEEEDEAMEFPKEEGDETEEVTEFLDEEEAKPPKQLKVESVDYSAYDKNMFNKKTSADAFDPFHQQFRLENKKNLRGKRGGKGGFSRMGTQTTGYKPDAKKKKN